MTFETSKRLDKWMENHNKKCATHTTANTMYGNFYQAES